MTHWRTQPKLRVNDLCPIDFHEPSFNSTEAMALPKTPILDLTPKTDRNEIPHLSPIIDAKRSQKLWNSFQVSPNTRRLPFVELVQETCKATIVDQQEAQLPLEKPHAIALGLAAILIAIGLLSFKL